MSAYTLGHDAAAARRLLRLDRAKWPTTLRLLERAGLRPGLKVLDVGCGIGGVSLRLAGIGALVTGTDINDRFLTLARRRAARRGLGVEFQQLPVEALEDEAAYDLVFARYLLSHLVHPAEAIGRLVHAMRPGGRLAVEDLDIRVHRVVPPLAEFERYVELYRAVVVRNGGDPSIGPKLAELLAGAGLTTESVEPVTVVPRLRGRSFAAMTLRGVTPAILEAELAQPAEIDHLIAALDRHANQPGAVESLALTYGAVGTRPE